MRIFRSTKRPAAPHPSIVAAQFNPYFIGQIFHVSKEI